MRSDGIWILLIIAVPFAMGIGGLIYSMFTLPSGPSPRPCGVGKANNTYVDRIFVPVGAGLPAVRPVSLACRLGRDLGAEIVLAYVLVVPTTVPLDVVLPEQETAAREVLARAAFLVAGNMLPVRSRILRSRSVGEGILRLAEDEDASTIVLGIGARRWPWSGLLGAAASEVIRHARCPVVLVSPPAEAVPISTSTDRSRLSLWARLARMDIRRMV